MVLFTGIEHQKTEFIRFPGTLRECVRRRSQRLVQITYGNLVVVFPCVSGCNPIKDNKTSNWFPHVPFLRIHNNMLLFNYSYIY